jgi:hypothetical protein
MPSSRPNEVPSGANRLLVVVIVLLWLPLEVADDLANLLPTLEPGAINQPVLERAAIHHVDAPAQFVQQPSHASVGCSAEEPAEITVTGLEERCILWKTTAEDQANKHSSPGIPHGRTRSISHDRDSKRVQYERG